jgi:hypothetical protein
MHRCLWAIALLGITLVIPSGAGGAAPRTLGTLPLRATFKETFYEDVCPPGWPSSTTECFDFSGKGIVPGLGTATVNWKLISDISSGLSCQHFAFTTIVITVAGKGAIDASLTDLKTHCWQRPPAVYGPFGGTITGGSGAYTGASGTVQVTQNEVDEVGGAGDAIDMWTGALSVPGLEFNLTPPTLHGVHNRTVRARKSKLVRVRYAVTARDADGRAVPATCAPRSGSFFKRGQTKVTCSATDANGNTASATFVVTVKR